MVYASAIEEPKNVELSRIMDLGMRSYNNRIAVHFVFVTKQFTYQEKDVMAEFFNFKKWLTGNQNHMISHSRTIFFEIT